MSRTVKIVELLIFALLVFLTPSWLFKGLVLGYVTAYLMLD